MKKKFYLEGLISALVLSAIFSLGFNSAVQVSSVVNTGYYRIFKKGTLIGNIKNYDEIALEVLNRYGAKVGDQFFLGDGVSIEYAAYENPVSLSRVDDLLDDLDIQVEGLRVKTNKGKMFNTASYREWQNALGNIVKFIQLNDKKTKTAANVAGEVRVTENFTYNYERMPIKEAKTQKEIEQSLIFSDVFNIKTDVVKTNDTIDSVAKRNKISVEQLVYVNELDTKSLLLPGTALNVSPLNYSVEFNYPVIENIIEDISFEIEYENDDSKYVDEEEIIKKGENGAASVQYLSYVVNGKSVPGQRLQYKVLREANKQVVKRGTKRRISISDGGDAPHVNAAGFIWPTQGICISAEYMDPYYPGLHYGLDIAGNHGTSVWAVAPGTVESAEYNGAWGLQVMINHHNGLKTRYGHLSSIGVHKGTEVSQGKYVGGMGNTGWSFGTHLHFEVHSGGSRYNPRIYLPTSGLRRC